MAVPQGCLGPTRSDPAHTITLGDSRSPVISGAGPLRHLVAGEAAVDRLAQEAEQAVADVLAAPAFGESRHGHRGQAEGVVQLAVGEQAPIRGDPGAVELELEATVEGDPQGLFGFTRHVRHLTPVKLVRGAKSRAEVS